MSSRNVEISDNEVRIIFEATLDIKKTGCNINLVDQDLLMWRGPNFTLELFLSKCDQSYEFKVVLNGMVKLSITQSTLDCLSFKLIVSKSKLCFMINEVKKNTPISVNLVGTHYFEPHVSDEIKLRKPKVTIKSCASIPTPQVEEETEKCCYPINNLEEKLKTEINTILDNVIAKGKACGCMGPVRENFCKLNLGIDDCHGEEGEIINGRRYLTPEISYEVKNMNLDLHKKNNIDNRYTKPSMANQLCISNPLHSLRAFIMDFVVKNLILFGLLMLFQYLLSSPQRGSIDTTTMLKVAAVVVIIYNLIYWIFKALENIFIWACQYSHNVTDLVDDTDQWL